MFLDGIEYLYFFQPPSSLKCDAQFARLVSEAIYHLYYTPQLAIHPNAIPHLILHSQCLYHFNVWPLKTIRVLQSESEKIVTMKCPIYFKFKLL